MRFVNQNTIDNGPPHQYTSVNTDPYLESEDVVFRLPTIATYDTRTCIPKANGGGESCLPEIISPGVQKSGTSFVYSYLVKHPHIEKSSIKELNYFWSIPQRYPTGIELYTQSYATAPTLVNIDFSPRYLMLPESAELIYQTNRATKFVVMLRDPVDRAYSHFRYQQKLYKKAPVDMCTTRQQVTFKEYITEEFGVLSSCGMISGNTNKPNWSDSPPVNCTVWKVPRPTLNPRAPVPGRCKLFFPNSNAMMADTSIGYLSHGLYVGHLEHYFKFFPRKNFLFIRYEDLQERGEVTVLNEIAEWIGVDALDASAWGPITEVNGNEYPDMSPEEENFLISFYRNPNQRLYELLGRDMGWKK